MSTQKDETLQRVINSSAKTGRMNHPLEIPFSINSTFSSVVFSLPQDAAEAQRKGTNAFKSPTLIHGEWVQ